VPTRVRPIQFNARSRNLGADRRQARETKVRPVANRDRAVKATPRPAGPGPLTAGLPTPARARSEIEILSAEGERLALRHVHAPPAPSTPTPLRGPRPISGAFVAGAGGVVLRHDGQSTAALPYQVFHATNFNRSRSGYSGLAQPSGRNCSLFSLIEVRRCWPTTSFKRRLSLVVSTVSLACSAATLGAQRVARPSARLR
jgi:hypothetical protein